jgi:predicted site-specific integrase-resolvase
MDFLIDEKKAAEVLGVAVKTLTRWRWARKGPPYYRVGGIRYRLVDLDRYVQSNRVENSQ